MGRQTAAEKNRLHQILTDGRLRPDVVVSNVHSTAARKMVDALTAGASIQDVLTLASKRFKVSREKLFDALGDEMTPSHLFVLNEPMHHIEEIKARIAHFDGQLLAGMAEQRKALALLQTIPGIDLIGATMLLVEIGIYVDASGKPDR